MPYRELGTTIDMTVLANEQVEAGARRVSGAAG